MSKLNINDPECWNQWRKLYDELSDSDHLDFLNQLEKNYPNQNHGDYDLFEKAIRQALIKFNRRIRVMEIGGWKGQMADHFLSRPNEFDISQWVNFEACRSVRSKQICDNQRYEFRWQYKFRWFLKRRWEFFDIGIASHVLEHFSENDVMSILRFMKGIPVLAFEIPLGKHFSCWDNYVGSHKLEWGWDKFDQVMKSMGYFKTKFYNDSFGLYQLLDSQR